jgi:hypothetical protein
MIGSVILINCSKKEPPVVEKELFGFVLNMHDMFVDRC